MFTVLKLAHFHTANKLPVHSPSFLNRLFTSLKWKSSEQSASSSPFLKCFATSFIPHAPLKLRILHRGQHLPKRRPRRISLLDQVAPRQQRLGPELLFAQLLQPR